MKKFKIHNSVIIIFLLISLVFSGCVKDTCTQMYTYTYYKPVYKTTAEVRANIKNNAPREIQNAGKIFIRGNYIFLNEVDKGFHIIDNRNPALPVNLSFIDIPGNVDLAVKGNTLYADLYTDLVTLDISNPLNVLVKKYNEGVFPYRAYSNGFSGDTSKVIVDWVKRDTSILSNCGGGRWFDSIQIYYSSEGDSKNNNVGNSGSPIGQGGSMARFAIVENAMYTVSDADLNVFDISDAHDPVFTNALALGGWGIETIFPFKNKLFIGTQSGMFTFNINNPAHPKFEGKFEHAQSCDPIVADDDYAYVTLRSGNACQGFTNQLDILKLNNFTNPTLVKSYPLTNPHGLSKDGNLLFICDGDDGVKVFDAANVNNLLLLKHFTGLSTYDVIAYNTIAIVIARDGLYQYDYSNANNIHLVSKTNFSKN